MTHPSIPEVSPARRGRTCLDPLTVRDNREVRENNLLDIVSRFADFAEEVNAYPYAVNLAFESFGHLYNYMKKETNPPVESLNNIRKRLEEASVRRDTLLHCHLAMGLWSAFDAAVNDFVVEVIAEYPDKLDADRIKSMRLPVNDALLLRRRQLAQRVVDDFKVAADGFGRADALMSLIGVSVQVNPRARRRVLELQQRRNAIAHRGSVVDERVAQKCPWLANNLGKRISIEHRELRIYALHLTIYLSDALHSFGKAQYGDSFVSAPNLVEWREMAIALEDPTKFNPQDWA